MDDSYYWKENEKVQYALAKMKCQTHIIDGTVKCTNKRGHNIDNKLLFISSYFVYISKDKESKISSIDKLTKYLDILRRTRCILFERGVSLCDILLHAKENIKCLSVTKTISINK